MGLKPLLYWKLWSVNFELSKIFFKNKLKKKENFLFLKSFEKKICPSVSNKSKMTKKETLVNNQLPRLENYIKDRIIINKQFRKFKSGLVGALFKFILGLKVYLSSHWSWRDIKNYEGLLTNFLKLTMTLTLGKK